MEITTNTISIETSITGTADGTHTYLIKKRLVGAEGGKGVIVLLYPTRSVTNVYADDSTMNHITAHLQEMGLNEISIINLFSKVVSGKPSTKGLTVDRKNLEFIEQNIFCDPRGAEDRFILAWGQSMEKNVACTDTKRLLTEMYHKYRPDGKIYKLATKAMPDEIFPHPLYLGIRQKNSKWYLAECELPVKSEGNAPKAEAKGKRKREMIVLTR